MCNFKFNKKLMKMTENQCPVCCGILNLIKNPFYYCTACNKEFKKIKRHFEEVNHEININDE